MRRNSTDSTEEELSPQQNALITALLAGKSVAAAASAIGIHRTTFYVWRQSGPGFCTELNRRLEEQAETMRAQLRALADDAVSTVREMLTGDEVPPMVRLRAAVAVLSTLGILEPQATGSTDLSEIEMDMLLHH